MRAPEKYGLGLIVVLAMAALVWALLGDLGFREVLRLRTERQELAAEVERLRKKRKMLEKTVLRLGESPQAIEARERSDLGMIRKGETVFLLPERHGPKR